MTNKFKLSQKVLFILFAFISFNANAREVIDAHTLLINTSAEVEAPVDNVMINLQVNSRDADLQKAKDDNNKRYAKVLKNITGELGLSKDAIQSNFVSVNPVYVQCYQPPNKPMVKCDAGKIDFYMVNRSVQLKLDKLEKYDELIEVLTKDGATEINTGQYGVSNIEDYKDKARDKAIDSAKAKAERITAKLGVKLLKPIHFEANDSGAVPYYRPMAMMKSAMVESAAAPAPTDPETLGKIKVTSNVSITYEIE